MNRGTLCSPQRNNRTTKIAGISETYKTNKLRDGKTYRCYSVHIGPQRTVSRNFNDVNMQTRLMEAMAIRDAAVKDWPRFTTGKAQLVSMKFYHLRRLKDGK